MFLVTYSPEEAAAAENEDQGEEPPTVIHEVAEFNHSFPFKVCSMSAMIPEEMN